MESQRRHNRVFLFLLTSLWVLFGMGCSAKNENVPQREQLLSCDANSNSADCAPPTLQVTSQCTDTLDVSIEQVGPFGDTHPVGTEIFFRVSATGCEQYQYVLSGEEPETFASSVILSKTFDQASLNESFSVFVLADSLDGLGLQTERLSVDGLVIEAEPVEETTDPPMIDNNWSCTASADVDIHLVTVDENGQMKGAFPTSQIEVTSQTNETTPEPVLTKIVQLDSDTKKVSFSGFHSGAGNTHEFNALFSDTGLHNVIAKVQRADGTGDVKECRVAVALTSIIVSDPMSCTLRATPSVISSGSSTTFQLTTTGPVRFSWLITDTVDIPFPANSALTGTISEVGTHTVKAVVSDGQTEQECSTTLTVF